MQVKYASEKQSYIISPMVSSSVWNMINKRQHVRFTQCPAW